MAVPDPPRRGRRHRRGNDIRSREHQREDRSEEVRGAEMSVLLGLLLVAQTASGGTLPVTVVDPTILQQQLDDMAGPGAVIRIDGFEGGTLPPKAMIRSIRIARDQFAAEFHSAGGVSIEIITQPGIGPMRYFSNALMRDSSLSGTSPFVPVRGAEQNVNYGFGLGGTIVKDKSSFFLNVFGIDAYDTPNVNAVMPAGTISRALNLQAPRNNLFVNSELDYAVTLDQTLRFGYNLTHVTNDNLGVGGYSGPDRAYSTDTEVNTLRVQHFGPVGRRAFSRSRIQLIQSDSRSQSSY